VGEEGVRDEILLECCGSWIVNVLQVFEVRLVVWGQGEGNGCSGPNEPDGCSGCSGHSGLSAWSRCGGWIDVRKWAFGWDGWSDDLITFPSITLWFHRLPQTNPCHSFPYPARLRQSKNPLKDRHKHKS